MTPPLASTLPEHSNDGYVAAAYIVFVAIVLIYVTIMAVRLSRMERDLRELRTRAEQPQPTAQTRPAGRPPGGDEARSQPREREAV